MAPFLQLPLGNNLRWRSPAAAGQHVALPVAGACALGIRAVAWSRRRTKLEWTLTERPRRVQLVFLDHHSGRRGSHGHADVPEVNAAAQPGARPARTIS